MSQPALPDVLDSQLIKVYKKWNLVYFLDLKVEEHAVVPV